MLKYVVNRLLSLIPVILVTSFLIYWAMSLTEGDPAMMIAGDGASKEMIDQIRHELGLDQPFLLQYFNYMRGMLVGDMGKSYVTNKDVFHTFFQYLPNTLYLGGAAVIIATLVSIPLGIYTATWNIGGSETVFHRRLYCDGFVFNYGIYAKLLAGLDADYYLCSASEIIPDRRQLRLEEPGSACCNRRLRSGSFDYPYYPFLHAGRYASGLYDHRAC